MPTLPSIHDGTASYDRVGTTTTGGFQYSNQWPARVSSCLDSFSCVAKCLYRERRYWRGLVELWTSSWDPFTAGFSWLSAPSGDNGLREMDEDVMTGKRFLHDWPFVWESNNHQLIHSHRHRNVEFGREREQLVEQSNCRWFETLIWRHPNDCNGCLLLMVHCMMKYHHLYERNHAELLSIKRCEINFNKMNQITIYRNAHGYIVCKMLVILFDSGFNVLS